MFRLEKKKAIINEPVKKMSDERNYKILRKM